MRKRIIALLIIMSMLMSTLIGCGIITKNNDRDLNQIVAEIGYAKSDSNFVYRTVNDGGNYDKGTYNEDKKKITKRDLTTAFMNYGQQLVQQYGMSIGEAVEETLKQLTYNEMLIQEAIREIVKSNGGKDYKISACFTADEIALLHREAYDSEFKQIKSIYEDILKERGLDKDTTEDEEEADDEEEAEPTDRAKQNPVFEDEKDYEPIYVKADEPTNDNWKAAVKRYEKLLNKNEKGLDREKYYNKIFNSLMERDLVEKYQEMVEDQALKAWMGDNDYKADSSKAADYVTNLLNPRYEEQYKQQMQKYDADKSAFVTDLKAGSSTMLYSPVSGYFYVKNLLIGVSDEQKAEIDAINALDKNEAYKKAEISKILAETEIKDLRNLFEYEAESYIDKEGKVIDREIPKAIEFPSYLPNMTEFKVKSDFSAETYWNAKTKKYDLKKAKEENTGNIEKTEVSALINGEDYSSFVSYIKTRTTTLAADTDYKESEVFDKSKTDAENAFATLIFKYGTDPGMFNNAKDYLVSVSGKEDYVSDFTKASREAYVKYQEAQGDKQAKQLASIVVVPTDFGWHVIMVTGDVQVGKLESLNANHLGEGYENSFTYKFNDTFQTEIKSEAYSLRERSIIEKYEAQSGFVTTYKKTYNDLLKLK